MTDRLREILEILKLSLWPPIVCSQYCCGPRSRQGPTLFFEVLDSFCPGWPTPDKSGQEETVKFCKFCVRKFLMRYSTSMELSTSKFSTQRLLPSNSITAQRTRIMGLVIVKSLTTQYQIMTDGQTDRRTDGQNYLSSHYDDSQQ